MPKLGFEQEILRIVLSCGTPCSLLKVNRRFGGTHRLRFQCRRINQVKNQSEACDPEDVGDMSPEKSVEFQQTTRRYIPEDRKLHNHRCENLKSYESFCAHAVQAVLQPDTQNH
jgi:hypothetical protein